MSKHDADPRHNHPTLTWDRMSAWQKKQYGVKPKATKPICRKCQKEFTPKALGQPFCTNCGALDANGRMVSVGSPVRIARWQTAKPESGAEVRTGIVYKIDQQSDKRWVLHMRFPPAQWKRDTWCAFSYDMVLAPVEKAGQQLTLF